MTAEWKHSSVTDRHTVPQGVPARILIRVLRSVALLLSASAAIVLFIGIPYELLERRLPNWDIFNLIFLLFPIVIAWQHAGLYMLLCVTICGLALVLLNPGVRRARIEAIGMVGICAVLYIFMYLSMRFRFFY
jgi:D-alanyl-lipoteichoic acid acyltransferase DltB (MBOAT superfamily)